jgi:hypothetical protein
VPDTKPVGKPDAGYPHVRFDERGGEADCSCSAAPLLDSAVHLRLQLLVWRPQLRDRPLLCYKRVMDRQDIIARLRENEAALRARGVTHAALFGSRARGDARRSHRFRDRSQNQRREVLAATGLKIPWCPW